MAKVRPFHLFVYGTLMNPQVFRAVTGYRIVLHSYEADAAQDVIVVRRAILDGYKKVSVDNTYLYAVPERHGRIRGFLIGPLPGEVMEALRHYEGRNYSKKTVRVMTPTGFQPAVAFLGNIKQLRHSFGYAFHDPFKQEILLTRKIENALLAAEREQLRSTEPITRRAIAELHGPRIRDLVRKHFEAGGISDYAINHALKDQPLPDYARLRDDSEACKLAGNYLNLVIRQVIFNQIEDQIRKDFRYELDRMDLGHAYYDRTISALVTLRLLNQIPRLLDVITADCMTDLRFKNSRLIDFVRWGIVAADSLYDPMVARRELNFVRNHMGHGGIPLGAEMEFSNIGHEVILDPQARECSDSIFDGFYYFNDFGLNALTWKLGGHVDDHHEKVSDRPRRGFFEIAIGNLSLEASISKPIADDPWTLGQVIHEVRRFFDIRPHSVHVSLQLRSQHKPDRDRLLPLHVMQCLFAIAGDPGPDATGAIRVRRLSGNEIVGRDPVPHMLFSDISIRRSTVEESGSPASGALHSGGRYVQQFRFMRLSSELNYEPIILGLKGIQIAERPGSFITPAQYEASPRHRQMFHDLVDWGVNPQPIPSCDVDNFLAIVRRGLLIERRRRQGHTDVYIAWAISHLRSMIENFNVLLGEPARKRARPTAALSRRKRRRP